MADVGDDMSDERAALNRRRLLRTGAVAAPAGLAATLLGGLAASADAETDTSGSLVGSWAVTITFPGSTQESERGLFAFMPGGVIIETNTRSKYPGIGSWRMTGASTFAFVFREQAFDATGAYVGEIHVAQTGRLTSSTAFTCDGTGTIHDPSGNPVTTVTSHGDAVRYTTADTT
ncbi:hypothetical protein Airi01_037610 [Actinoallomurus iriomotensis]|uniref:Uncharacterized protein n=2 Tax=Thermomonosporaceae TaxID=2012 RepID=A0A9W6RH65_9ACTN|nr:hypothetical protein Airi01_037610 [Actinoallomurus iriomotensis]